MVVAVGGEDGAAEVSGGRRLIMKRSLKPHDVNSSALKSTF